MNHFSNKAWHFPHLHWNNKQDVWWMISNISFTSLSGPGWVNVGLIRWRKKLPSNAYSSHWVSFLSSCLLTIALQLPRLMTMLHQLFRELCSLCWFVWEMVKCSLASNPPSLCLYEWNMFTHLKLDNSIFRSNILTAGLVPSTLSVSVTTLMLYN